jgi:hypothetical protein
MRAFQDSVSGRFHRANKALAKIYTDVITQLDKIDPTTRKINATVDVVLGILAKHSQRLDRIERNLSQYVKEGERAELREVMLSTLLRPARAADPIMTGADYRALEARSLSWAVDRLRDTEPATNAKQLLHTPVIHLSGQDPAVFGMFPIGSRSALDAGFPGGHTAVQRRNSGTRSKAARSQGWHLDAQHSRIANRRSARIRGR